MNNLGKKIKEILNEQNVSASALERKAGIGPSSLQNILQGRVKNPSLEIIKAIASALGYTVSELLGETSKPSHILAILKDKEWNQQLYLNVIKTVLAAYEQQDIKADKIEILEAIENIYDYCLKYDKKKPDRDFVEWTIIQKSNGGAL